MAKQNNKKAPKKPVVPLSDISFLESYTPPTIPSLGNPELSQADNYQAAMDLETFQLANVSTEVEPEELLPVVPTKDKGKRKDYVRRKVNELVSIFKTSKKKKEIINKEEVFSDSQYTPVKFFKKIKNAYDRKTGKSKPIVNIAELRNEATIKYQNIGFRNLEAVYEDPAEQ